MASVTNNDQIKLSSGQKLALNVVSGVLQTGFAVGANSLGAHIFGYHVPTIAVATAISVGTLCAVQITTKYLEEKDVISEGQARCIDAIAVTFVIASVAATFFTLGMIGPVTFGISCAAIALFAGFAAYAVYTVATTGHSPQYHLQQYFASKVPAQVEAKTE